MQTINQVQEEIIEEFAMFDDWMDYVNGKLYFRAESDAVIVKGLLALVLRVFSGRTPEEINAVKLTFLNEVGLTEHLSPTRSNGLLAVIKQIRFYAIAYKTKENQTK